MQYKKSKKIIDFRKDAPLNLEEIILFFDNDTNYIEHSELNVKRIIVLFVNCACKFYIVFYYVPVHAI